MCSNCGSKGHIRSECKAILPRFINCGRAHDAASKECPKYINEKEICCVKVDEHISFKEARLEVMSIQARKANHDINPDFQSSNENRATQSSSKSKGKLNFYSISQLMKTPPSNRNRYSFLQCSQHEEGECDDVNLQETYASVTARQNSNLHSTLSPCSITPGQRHQNRT